MEKTDTLKDGNKVLVRPLQREDLGGLRNVFQSLPPDDRKYLRFDATKLELLEARLRRVEEGKDIRIVGVVGDSIAAQGVLELPDEGWRQHQGEIRLVVAPEFQRRGLGTIMIRELYLLASKQRMKRIVVKMMRPQVAARTICRKLGFREETLIPDYVQDQSGHLQDLLVMSSDLEALWTEVEVEYQHSDWRRCR